MVLQRTQPFTLKGFSYSDPSCYDSCDNCDAMIWQGYSVHEDDDHYSISIDVPDVNARDMVVQLESSGHVLNVSGARKLKNGVESRFSQRFLLSDGVDTEKLAANLAGGVLVVAAPRNPPQKRSSRLIKIMEDPPPVPGSETIPASNPGETKSETSSQVKEVVHNPRKKHERRGPKRLSFSPKLRQ
jgi:HSP20 family molecular chaperone IbpA